MTEHYARGEEKPIAAFDELDDARMFLTKKSDVDDEERKKVIYRLYDDQDLLYEINKEGVSATHALYAEGNGYFSDAVPFSFQVMIESYHSLERKTVAQFAIQTDASLFARCKSAEDNTFDANDLLMILKDNCLIETLNKTIIANQKKESSDSGTETGSSYTLSPLSTRPTPSGGPPDYWVKNEDHTEGSE